MTEGIKIQDEWDPTSLKPVGLSVLTDIHHTALLPPFWNTEVCLEEGQAVLRP